MFPCASIPKSQKPPHVGGLFTYKRPGGTFTYKRPDGSSIYKRP